MPTRRRLLVAGGLALAGLGAPRTWAAARPVEVRMTGDPGGAHVAFEPVGLRIDPGTTVRWVVVRHVHTTTAYAGRIPRGAATWDSGYLVNPGDAFEVTFTVPGVYDYFCRPHEAAGMVGRVVVGRPPADAADGYPDSAVSPAARAALPPVREILASGLPALTLTVPPRGGAGP